MTKLKAILIDDESASLRSLSFELKTYCPEIEVIDAVQDPVKGISSIKENQPDLVFLDIEMPVMNGFELLQSISPINFDVIFVTAYDEFAVRAFEFNAVDYLLKPVLKSKLIQSVQKISQKKSHAFSSSHLEALINNIQRDLGETKLDSIAVPTLEGFEMVPVAEISYLKAEGNYTWLYQSEEKKHLISKTLKEVATIINRSHFYRAHKSYIVNLNHISRYIRGRGGYLVMKDGTSIPVARNQKQELMNLMNL